MGAVLIVFSRGDNVIMDPSFNLSNYQFIIFRN